MKFVITIETLSYGIKYRQGNRKAKGTVSNEKISKKRSPPSAAKRGAEKSETTKGGHQSRRSAKRLDASK